MQYKFDKFEIDSEAYELRENGDKLHIEPLVFDLILHLARNAGRVIPKQEIVDHVWGGRIVSDSTISGCVKSARRVLGDSGEDQIYVQTVRGRGFRFGADVAEGADAPASATVETAAARPAPPPSPSPSRQPMIAVLPFENQSADVEDYFADGLTEDIITNLSRFRELLLIARASTFRFRDSDQDISEFCARLGAAYAVVGTVRRAAGRVRISVQLVEAVTGVNLWADSYDREMEEISTIQDELTRTIAVTLGVKLQDVALQRALRKSPAELDAYDCVLRARRYTTTLTPDIHAEARDLLERAVALDPTNADAFALLANIYLAEHRFDANPQPDSIARAQRMAEQAVSLDGQNAYARCWLAIVHFFKHENDRFEAEAQRAIELNPNDPETLADIGHFLAFMGEFERGVALSRRARDLNPLYPGWYHFASLRYHYDRREYDAALSEAERVGMPDFYWTSVHKAAVQGQLGDPDAGETVRRILELKPDFSPTVELKKWNTAPADFDHLMDGLAKAGLETT